MQTDTLITVCAWCDIVLGSKSAKGAKGGTSHGICQDCYDAILPPVRETEVCDTCNGSGENPASRHGCGACPECRGLGEV
jgi:hypothetical protein